MPSAWISPESIGAVRALCISAMLSSSGLVAVAALTRPVYSLSTPRSRAFAAQLADRLDAQRADRYRDEGQADRDPESCADLAAADRACGAEDQCRQRNAGGHAGHAGGRRQAGD